ncbi:allene oxide cyclase barrel-like domain-containing protein [Streptomyces melanosporofaciens]|uniref:allene oxide cyclase barrel-like domain-containing protein n=1 Tax=unclassified Streptomyces TaxID=2593676 RepID=UPI0036BDDBB9
MPHVKRSALSAAAGLAAALCCAPLAVAAAPAAATGPLPHRHMEEVFLLTARPTQTNSVDVAPPGNSQGDQLIVAGDLLRSNVTVGRFDETCTVTRTSPMDSSDLQCQITLSLSEGQITVQGVFAITGAGPGDITLAITGGTGRFRTAHGFIHAVNSSNTETQLTVHLIR